VVHVSVRFIRVFGHQIRDMSAQAIAAQAVSAQAVAVAAEAVAAAGAQRY
jgi:hypothetical protein